MISCELFSHVLNLANLGARNARRNCKLVGKTRANQKRNKHKETQQQQIEPIQSKSRAIHEQRKINSRTIQEQTKGTPSKTTAHYIHNMYVVCCCVVWWGGVGRTDARTKQTTKRKRLKQDTRNQQEACRDTQECGMRCVDAARLRMISHEFVRF